MRKYLASVMVLLAVSGMQIGCGESTSESGALHSAVMSLDQAQRGYVPDGAGAEDARAYRQQALVQTAGELDALIASGSESQQIMARRMQADIDTSAAHYASRQAALAYAGLAPRTVKLLSHVAVADRATARRQGLDLNQPQLIEALQAEIKTQTARQQQLQAESTTLTEQLKAEQAAQAKVQAARDQTAAAAQALRDKGFVAEGDEQYELYNQAAAEQRKASSAMADMERRQLNIDMLNSRLGVVNSQLSLTNGLLAELKERVQVAQARQAEIEQGVTEAQQARDAALAALTAEFQEVLAAYQQQVDGPLDEAAQRMDQAVQHLQAASALADAGRDAALRQSVQADLLGALATQAQLLTEHMQVVGGFRQTLSLLSESVKRIDPQQAGVFDAAISQLAAEQNQLATRAREAIASAKQLAGRLSGGSGGVAEAAAAQTQRLDRLAGLVGNG